MELIINYMYEFSSSLSRGCLFHYAFQVQLARGSCRACVAFISFCFSFFVFFPSLFAKYNFYSYAIEQLLSCRVRWHPRPTPALGMSQQGKGDILTSGSAWVLYVGTSIFIEDLNRFLVVRQYHASTYPSFLQARS
jgi:hypothetical protein